MSDAYFRGQIDGATVFQVLGERERVLGEAMRYGIQYASDGEVTIQEMVGRKWVRRFVLDKMRA